MFVRSVGHVNCPGVYVGEQSFTPLTPFTCIFRTTTFLIIIVFIFLGV